MTKKMTKMKVNHDFTQHNIVWTTEDEKAFIDELGNHRKNSSPRSILLTKYINFMQSTRVNFQKLNKDYLIEYAKKELEQCQY